MNLRILLFIIIIITNKQKLYPRKLFCCRFPLVTFISNILTTKYITIHYKKLRGYSIKQKIYYKGRTNVSVVW